DLQPQAVAQGGGAGDVGAQVIPLDGVAAAGLNLDADLAETVDRQPLDRAAPGRDLQAAGPRAGEAAVQFDQRRAGVVRLRGAVDHHRPRDGRQGGGRANRLYAGVDGELDGVAVIAGVVGVEDGLAE